MHFKYIVLAVLLANVSGTFTQEISQPIEQEEYYDDDSMRCACVHLVQDDTKRKAVRLARIISGVLGMCTVEVGETKYSNPFALFNGMVNLYRGLIGREIEPKDTGKFKKFMAALGLFTINPFAIINSAMILWDGME